MPAGRRMQRRQVRLADNHAASLPGRPRPGLTGSILACVLLVPGWLIAAEGEPRVNDRPIDFNRDVRPILSDTCFHCHGPDHETREADLRFDQEDSVRQDRGGYQVVKAGDLASSELWKRITSHDESDVMPPPDSGKSLTPAQRDILKRWIESGAGWSMHWAYVPPGRTDPPQVKDKAWTQNWIDRFVLKRIEDAGLSPTPDADPVTLVRRLAFDLTGLPPRPEWVASMQQDASAENVARLVDEMLADKAFGERLAVYWLDLVRYADTVGYHGDQDHSISPYRDYVIDAFNSNMPFDQFTREQLAGDQLPDPTIDQIVATGYNRLLQTSHEGGVQPKEYLAIYAADRVRNVSAVWMGATLGCAQCHDHKYDPYTTRDFYSMVAFFADIDEAQHFKVGSNALPTRRPPEIDVLSRPARIRVAEIDAQLKELEARLRMTPNDAALEKQRDSLQSEREAIQKTARKTMITVSIEPREIRVLPRGNWLDDSGEVVDPSVPGFLGHVTGEDRRATRLDLANWLVDAKQGSGLLTARVFANRFWYLTFGTGIAPILDDLGGQGSPPVAPELLDQLAHEFVDSGWDVKHMLKLIVTSRAYRQDSRTSDELIRLDPQNQLFARQARFRLPAEMIRDNALAISGLLVDEVGGGSVRPYQPVGYYRHLNFPPRKYQHDSDSRQWRRGVYVHWQRQFLHPMLKAFDAPSREECTASRPRSNTPLAALTLLNDPTFVESARVFAASLLQDSQLADDRQRLDTAFQRAVSRLPDPHERRLLMEVLEASRREYAENPEAAGQLAAIGASSRPDQLDVRELASWSSVTRVLLNLSETNTRN